MIKILFVCLGNICRSPLAEAILNHKVKEKGLAGKIKCDSCGTSDYHIGEFPDERSVQCAKSRGILISHRGRQINKFDLKDFDYLIVMDQSTMRTVQKLLDKYSISHHHLYLMREFHPGTEQLDVPDPYYGEEDGFEEVYKILEESLDNFLNQITKDPADDIQSR
jgi:protein-tyrosine phosphatase